MRLLTGCIGLALLASGAAFAAPPPVKLVPHKAVYDLSLLSSEGPRGIDAARGRIAFDFSGDACEGYALSFRQVTVLESAEGEPKTSDLRTTTFEDGGGASFKFRTESLFGPGPAKVVDGDADRRPKGGLAVRVTKPNRDRLDALGDVLFPTAHMKTLIEAAQRGETLVSAKVFDGSDDGRKVYDTLSVIGRKIEPGSTAGLEEVAKTSGLDKLVRWPVTISYFTEGDGERTPIYTITFELFQNGVSGALKLSYGNFALKGEMKTLELMPATDCKR